jgi:putative ABC transport system substrate-binding protein
MRRREFITLLGGAAAAWPLAARAQQARKVWRLGMLQPGAPPEPLLEVIRDGLRDLGYMEGRDIVFEIRWAEGKHDRLGGLAAELVGLKVDAIHAFTTSPGLRRRRSRSFSRRSAIRSGPGLWPVSLAPEETQRGSPHWPRS